MPDNNEFQARVIECVSKVLAEEGFALGGGQAFRSYGISDRLSTDADFYTTSFETEDFDRAQKATTDALEAHGFTVEVRHHDSWLRELSVIEPASGNEMTVDLGQDYRRHEPAPNGRFEAVLNIDDLVAGKTRAIYERGAVRDYIDIDSLLKRPEWPAERIAEQFRFSCPTVPMTEFSTALSRVDQLDPSAFSAYDLTADDVQELCENLRRLATKISKIPNSVQTKTQSHAAEPITAPTDIPPLGPATASLLGLHPPIHNAPPPASTSFGLK